jgi:hypothetical protein
LHAKIKEWAIKMRNAHQAKKAKKLAQHLQIANRKVPWQKLLQIGECHGKSSNVKHNSLFL